MLNLRLPGQYFDAESGLHDNHHRSYDPRPSSPMKGRYVSPDPLGYVDGPDPYLYASGDPINKIDPMGLYQSDIHYYMTFFLALAAGVNYEHARTIALAAQYVDDNNDTRPLNVSFGHTNRLYIYHFTMWTGDERNPTYSDSTELADPRSRSAQLQRLFEASQNAPHDCARLQFFGEYLHAFQDTFSHRDRHNMPIGANAGLGHAAYGHHPDMTFDHDQLIQGGRGSSNTVQRWQTNEARTLQMEREVFAQLQSFGNGGTSFEAIEEVLRQFNATRETEATGLRDKLAILQREIDRLGFRDGEGHAIVLREEDSGGYNERLAAERRRQNLCADGRRLQQSQYPGTILPREGVPCI